MIVDIGLGIYYVTVVVEVEYLGLDIFCLYGKALVRSMQDPSFNRKKLMAYEKYIKDKGIKWDD